jgi:hypothetical protein
MGNPFRFGSFQGPYGPQPGPNQGPTGPTGGATPPPPPGFFVPEDTDSGREEDERRRERDADADHRRREQRLHDDIRKKDEDFAKMKKEFEDFRRSQTQSNGNSPRQDQQNHAQFARDYFQNNNQTQPGSRPNRSQSANPENRNDDDHEPEVRLPPPRRLTGRITCLPPAEQFMADQAAFNSLQAETVELRRLIQQLAARSPNSNPETQENIRNLQNKQDEVDLHKNEIDKAQQLALRFKCSIKMPRFDPPPRGYYRRDDLLTVKNIKQSISTFNPGATHPTPFHDVWDSVLQFGQGEYLNELEYYRVLGFAFQGDALRTFQDLRSADNSFEDIMETISDIYATQKTLLEDQKDVDDFTRAKNESITITMRRCGVLVERLRAMYDEAAWPEMRFRLMRQVLRQVMTEKTRRHIDLHERSAIKAGNRPGIKALIMWAQDFEDSHDEVPKKDTPTMIQSASGDLKSWTVDAVKDQDQIKYLKQQQFLSKNMDKKLEDIYQLAAATMKRTSSLERRFKDPLHQIQKKKTYENRDHSAASKSSLPDEDVEMKSAEPLPSSKPRSSFSSSKPPYKKDRADKPQERGRSKERSSRSARSSTPFQPSTGRSGSQGSQTRGRRNGSRSESQHKSRGSSQERAPITIMTGKLPGGIPLYENRGVQYWICHSCPAVYKPDETCEHLQTPEN